MSYDLAFWAQGTTPSEPADVCDRLFDDDATGLKPAPGVPVLRRRILKTFPDWRDSAIATEGRHDDRYVFLTIPWVLATTDALNRLHEWAVELELVMFDPQIGQALALMYAPWAA